jgi:two-component system, NtrC family, response regulator AtoC
MPNLALEWQNSHLLAAVFNQLSDALIIYDSNLRISGVNHAAERLFGLTSEEMVGRDCREVFKCGVCEPGCGVLVGIQQLPSVSRSTVRLHTDNGRERLAIISTTQILDDQGQLEGAVATIKDITDEVAPQRREVVAESRLMRDVINFTKRVAASEAATILLEGENGTGKDLIAKTLHYESMRRSEPFIAINCAAIPDTLLESELFGYEKGAFTDARAQKRGIFELADKGTLFLDEIGEIPLMLQAKLLRVLEEQCFRRLGGLKDIQLNLRVIAATNRNLRDQVSSGAFRQDLFFRLNVIHITIPSLRERREDIVPLARFFVNHYNTKFKRHIEGITPDACRLLGEHDWPGNVRELRNAIERAMILEESRQITPASLPMSVNEHPVAMAMAVNAPAAMPDSGLSLAEHERMLLAQALEKANGNQTQAARLLHITRDTLRYKMKKFNLR